MQRRNLMIPSTITLSVAQGFLKGREYSFVAPARCVIGRARDCDIQLPGDCFHADVSRHHCVLDIAPPAIHVRDLGSRNGTFVNGVRIDDSADEQPEAPVADGLDLKDGDQFQLGSTAFQVKVESVAAVPALPLFF
jgi:pSer/pThr/pTyr-binding forkhead associated (FHA) protein